MGLRCPASRTLAAGSIGLLAMAVAAQDVPLAERRTILVNGEPRVIVSKLSKLNPNTSRVRAVVDVNFAYNFHHQEGKSVIVNMLNRFAAEEGWTVTHYYYNDRNNPNVDDRSKITLEELKKNLVVFANHISEFGTSKTAALQPHFERYLRETGGGMILMHGSGDTQNPSWAFYRDSLHPVNFQGHGNIVPGTIFRPAEAAGHPIMEGGILSAEMVINGQWHWFQKLITAVNPKAEVLLKVDPARCAQCGITGNRAFPGGNPIAWVMPVGKATVGYFGEGHDDRTIREFTQPVWDRFFKQMLFYVAGYDTLPLPLAARPAYARSPSGISFHKSSLAVYVAGPGHHKVGLYGLDGRKYAGGEGRGAAEYDFESHRKRLRPGVYILRVACGREGAADNRYMVGHQAGSGG